MADSVNPAAERRACVACNKSEVELPTGTGLKRCGRCQKTSHWPQHKAGCRRPPTPLPPPHPSLLPFFRQFKTDESKTYEMLIDTFRLRCDDDYAHGGHNHGIYGNDPPLPVFRDFLARAKAAGMLPPWWNDEKEKECERMAMEDEHFNIKFAVEKPDIQEHYKDNMMPMTLRGRRKCLWRWVRHGSEADARGLSVSMLKRDSDRVLGGHRLGAGHDGTKV
ncbi:hypothetical protein LTR47_000570 [Exophiala xenobiotica]|nr:hypothetical protein LTR47_000570 [Exophiala xenobiotica]KAK5544605.1 hypothetical protein LTR23_004369 [Chaetothyriales sp. CCFEE 6169]KAK5255749.1 hypothetical protein LTS06_000205 [Exophiala xenobiotica]KAK5261941.1 hypothetical protein LTR40_001320 [Exophiala xenobiotica]KAK5302463.1 hypothetical protein LTR14_000712 [Exophiala xenobiotica]